MSHLICPSAFTGDKTRLRFSSGYLCSFDMGSYTLDRAQRGGSAVPVPSLVGAPGQRIESQAAIYLAELFSFGGGRGGCGGLLLLCLASGAIICHLVCYGGHRAA